jgi:hypothetical protein
MLSNCLLEYLVLQTVLKHNCACYLVLSMYFLDSTRAVPFMAVYSLVLGFLN